MSHFTKVQTKIRDLNALKNALSEMGLTLDHNKPCRYYYGTKIKENVCKLRGPYDVSFDKNNDGTYSINADFYEGYVSREIGDKGSIIMRGYTIEKIKIEAAKKGYKIHQLPNGLLKIYDSADSSGGYIEASVDSFGDVSFRAKGFSGDKCMSFTSFEDAFGEVERKKTSDFYLTEKRAEVEYLRE